MPQPQISKEVLERIYFFNNNYDILFSSLDKTGIQYIGKKEDKICRFCGKNENETRFSEVAHAIPEAIGNKELILLEECNACNHLFSEHIEVHFDKISKVFRNIGQIKGKKKIPSYKSKDHKARIDFKDQFILKQTTNSDMSTVDEENKIIIINFDIEPFIPAAIYKTLVKMALSIAPAKELDNFSKTIEWIMHKDHSIGLMEPLIVNQVFIPGPRPNDKPVAILLKNKNINSTIKYPSYVFVLAYGNIVNQIIVPSSLDYENDQTRLTDVPLFPTPFETNWIYGNVTIDQFDFTSSEVQRGVKYPIHMSYEEKLDKDPDSEEIRNLL